MALLDHFNWKRIGIISEKSAVPRGIHDALSEEARRQNIDIIVQACKVTLSLRVQAYAGYVLGYVPHPQPFTSLPYVAMLLPILFTRARIRVGTHSLAFVYSL